VKKKLAVAFAVGFLAALVLWILGFSDEFRRFNLRIIDAVIEKVRTFIG